MRSIETLASAHKPLPLPAPLVGRTVILALFTACGAAFAGDGGRLSDACCSDRHHWAPLYRADPDAIRNVPPVPSADYLHMRLDLRINDMAKPVLIGKQTLTFRANSHDGNATSAIELDARLLKIESVMVGSQPAAFEHDGKKLKISIDPPLPHDREGTLTIQYVAEDPPLGLVWNLADTARPAQIHTQGQPETNSYWFPCHDFPNERLTTEIRVTVPGGYTACSNGRLLQKSNEVVPVESENGEVQLRPYETYHWLQDQPHVNYLVVLVVGKFDVVDVGTKTLSMPVYVPRGRAQDVPATFGRTAEMVDVFGRLFDEPYPWAKYAQLVVRNFGAGGMENTSATTLHDNSVIEPGALLDHDLEGLISHELAHQWFGDLLTCQSWEHIWLNEGFATYGTALWYENRTPALTDAPGESGPDAYDRQILGSFDGVIERDKAGEAGAVGMSSNVYRHPWETFRRPANPYGKGASVLHMLRQRLGDERFFAGIRLYVDRFKFKNPTTDDFRAVLEEVSGRNLAQFFDQWVLRPGVPHVDLDVTWNNGLLRITGKQTQPISADSPAFAFSLPVWVSTGGPGSSDGRVIGAIEFSGETASAEFPLPAEPQMVAINPALTTLAKLTIRQARERWLNQLIAGPSLPSRVQAARILASDDSEVSAERLRRVAVGRGLPTTLRVEAVRALRDRALESDLLAFLGVMDRWEVREEAAAAVATVLADPESKKSELRRAEAVRLLCVLARNDPSLKVRAASLRALGKLKSIEGRSLVLAALKTDSQSDTLRMAALDALVATDDAASLPLVVDAVNTAADVRTRESAARALGKLGKHDKEIAFALLSELLDTDQLRVRRAAGEALVELGDPRAKARIEQFVSENAAEELKAVGQEWLKSLAAK